MDAEGIADADDEEGWRDGGMEGWKVDGKWMESGWKVDGKWMESGWKVDGKWMVSLFRRRLWTAVLLMHRFSSV